MATTLQLTTRLSLSGTYRKTGTDGTDVVETVNKTFSTDLTTGTSANQADVLYHGRQVISASGTLSLDLKGSLEDSMGNAFTPAKIRGIVIENRETTSGLDVRFGVNSASVPVFGAAADYIIIEPGGHFFIEFPVDGVTVTATTADLVDVVNPSGSTAVTVDVWIWGTSA